MWDSKLSERFACLGHKLFTVNKYNHSIARLLNTIRNVGEKDSFAASGGTHHQRIANTPADSAMDAFEQVLLVISEGHRKKVRPHAQPRNTHPIGAARLRMGARWMGNIHSGVRGRLRTRNAPPLPHFPNA